MMKKRFKYELQTLNANRKILVARLKGTNLSASSVEKLYVLLELFDKIKTSFETDKKCCDMLAEKLPLLYLQIKRV